MGWPEGKEEAVSGREKKGRIVSEQLRDWGRVGGAVKRGSK